MDKSQRMPIEPTWDVDRLDYQAILNDWHAVCRVESVAEGQITPLHLMGEDLILWRHGGIVHAWKDYCRHRGARLSLGWVKNDRLVCPYHGWEYDTDGQCQRYPAHPSLKPGSRSRAYTHHVKEEYGHVWVCIGEPRSEIPPFPVWSDPSFRKINAGPYLYKANALRAVENFLDAAHFPFVHANLNGSADSPDELATYDVEETADGLTSSEIKVFQPYGDHRGIPVFARYRYSCFTPTTVYFNKQTGDKERFCTLMMVSPIDLDNCVVNLIVAINFGWELTIEQILKRQDMIFDQDRRIVETQRPHPIPIDVRDEIHLPSDKLGVEYRRWVQRRILPQQSSQASVDRSAVLN